MVHRYLTLLELVWWLGFVSFSMKIINWNTRGAWDQGIREGWLKISQVGESGCCDDSGNKKGEV